MIDEDAIFEDIRALSDEADEAGLFDVALVLEFALDVFLKETGRDEAPAAPDKVSILERSAMQMKVREQAAAHVLPQLGWSMSTFPLAKTASKAS